jgi:hypothetical protein
MVLEEEVDVLTKQKSTRIQWEINRNTTERQAWFMQNGSLPKSWMIVFELEWKYVWTILLFQTWSYCYKQHVFMSCKVCTGINDFRKSEGIITNRWHYVVFEKSYAIVKGTL